VGVDVLQDRRTTVSITGHVPLYPDWDAGPRYQSAIGEIGPARSTKVLQVRYGQGLRGDQGPDGCGTDRLGVQRRERPSREMIRERGGGAQLALAAAEPPHRSARA
jgi:hypothetical protein